MHKILLIDDDVELTAMLKDFLTAEGFEVSIANDGESAIQYILINTYDLAVLDVMMPGMDGFETLANIRTHSTLPIIMLTAKGDEADRFTGLEQGADDYVPKPCTPRELTARIRAILRRTNSNSSKPLENAPVVLGGLNVNPQTRIALWHQNPIKFTSVEFNILLILAQNVGKIVSKETLSQNGLGRPLTKFDRSIDVHLSSIRQKLHALSEDAPQIETIYRMGYQLVQPQ